MASAWRGFVVVLWLALPALGNETATSSGDEAPQQTYECTVMVPEMVTEMRTVKVCEWRNEQREGTYTACRHVPTTRTVEYEYTVPTYETRTREFVDFVFKPVIEKHQRNYTVMIPYTEKREGTRRVCKMVPTKMTRMICEDKGSWQEVAQQTCDCCGAGTQVCKVWVPKLEKRQVEYTVMRPQMEEVTCEYTVTLFRPEKRSEEVQVCNYVQEQRKRVVPYTVCVPQKRTGTREVTTYHTVEEQQNYTYTVQVPHIVEKQVPVQVCHMVAKKVTCKVPTCDSASCWCHRRCW